MADQGQGWYPHEGESLRYRVHIRFGEEPETMPEGWRFGRVSAVGTDSRGEVYVFHRGKRGDPLVVFGPKGEYLRSWGGGFFGNPHGLRVDAEDNLWVTDTVRHQALKFSREGELLLTLGVEREAGCDDRRFDKPTDVAFGPNGDLYVTDGYGNNRVVRFSKDGRYLGEWGDRGNEPGQFNLPHAAVMSSDGRLYVSDRHNDRIQVFDGEGRLLDVWTHLGATQGIDVSPAGELWVVTHRDHVENLTRDTLGGRLMKLDPKTGRILGSTESPGHWLHASRSGEIFIGSLTGNVFRWYPGWM